MMLKLYKYLMNKSKPLLLRLLERRVTAGKEDPERLNERKGENTHPRPDGLLYWVHAASIGEAQSALILIKSLLENNPKLHILMTTGTLTSAQIMKKNLPERAFHQFYPWDHPQWTQRFLEHWQPDLIFWMESELWPNMLLHIQKRNIPAALINARLSSSSYKKWRLLGSTAQKLLRSFALILCQSDTEKGYFEALGAQNIHTTDNLKYSAQPLSPDHDKLKALNGALRNRPCWLYASTHEGEEEIAARVHARLKNTIPDLLTLIIPRHPDRRAQIATSLSEFRLNTVFRGEKSLLPTEETELYIADTLGELGLFYRAAPIAMIGRTLSNDGGGGHNPIEAAQLHCAILHGPHTQNLHNIFEEMDGQDAAFSVQNQKQLTEEIQKLLSDESLLHKKQESAFKFSKQKTKVLARVLEHLAPLIQDIEYKR